VQNTFLALRLKQWDFKIGDILGLVNCTVITSKRKVKNIRIQYRIPCQSEH